MAILNMFPSGGAIRIKLATIADFYASPQNNSVNLTWSDPADKYTTAGDLAAEWLYTRIIRKEGSQPVGPNDGVLIVESMVRDQYKTTPFVDDNGVENGTTYYYAAYAYNTENVVNDGAFSSAKPVVFRPVLSDNSWAEIAEAAQLGRASEVWQIGDEKTFVCGSETLTAVITDFDHDNLPGGGKAPISFGIKAPMGQKHYWHKEGVNGVPIGDLDNYSVSVVRDWLVDTVFPTIEEPLRTIIKPATKRVARNYAGSINYYSVNDPIWLFGAAEIGFQPNGVSDGTQYPYYATVSNRPSGDVWLSALYYYYDSYFGSYSRDPYYLQNRTNLSHGAYSAERNIVFGFCI